MTQVLIDRALAEATLRELTLAAVTYAALGKVMLKDGAEATRDKLSAALANAEPTAKPETKLWLWKNFIDGRQEYWAFDNLYPINMTDGDPQTLGEPCGYALFKPSRNGRKEQL